MKLVLWLMEAQSNQNLQRKNIRKKVLKVWIQKCNLKSSNKVHNLMKKVMTHMKKEKEEGNQTIEKIL